MTNDFERNFLEARRRVASQPRAPDKPREPAKTGRKPQPSQSAWAHDAEISRLAKLSRLDYDHERKAVAKALNIRAPTLDQLVEGSRPKLGDDGGQGRKLDLPDREPWLRPVAGAALLSDLAAAVRQHVVMTNHAADAVALWVVHSYLLDHIDISPRLAITSPEKQCGKTTLLDVLVCLVRRPLSTANATASAIFRTIEMVRPTLLIDEGDTFLGVAEELRGILNSGHRRGGAVLRTVGDHHEPRLFATWSACAIAMIGRLPATLLDRSIAIELQRRLATERIEPFRLDRTGHLDPLARMAARWASDYCDRVRNIDPEMPSGLHNRAADNWRPLLAIADLVGGEWPERARAAIRSPGTEDDTTRVMLLADIRSVFAGRTIDRLPSADLVEALVAMEDRPWAEWRQGKPLTQNGLARLLKPFGITPTTVRVGTATPRGYAFAHLADAFERYIPPEGVGKPQHRNKCDETDTSCSFQGATREDEVADRKCKKFNTDGFCCTVAEQDPHAQEGPLDIPYFLPRAPDRAPALGPLGDSLDDRDPEGPHD